MARRQVDWRGAWCLQACGGLACGPTLYADVLCVLALCRRLGPRAFQVLKRGGSSGSRARAAAAARTTRSEGGQQCTALIEMARLSGFLLVGQNPRAQPLSM